MKSCGVLWLLLTVCIGTEHLKWLCNIYGTCEQSPKARVLWLIGSVINERKTHVVTLLLNSSHASVGPHRVHVWGNSIVRRWGSESALPAGTCCENTLHWKKEKYGIPLPEKEKLCSHVFSPLFTLSHHLHWLLLIASSSWFFKCDIYNRKAELVFGLFPVGLIMFVLPHLSGGRPYVGGVNPQMGLCNQWKAINHDACPRFWKFPALPANLKITRENWLSVALWPPVSLCHFHLVSLH